jgi:hypothetical protein
MIGAGTPAALAMSMFATTVAYLVRFRRPPRQIHVTQLFHQKICILSKK